MSRKPGDELNEYEFVTPAVPDTMLIINQSPGRDIRQSAPNVLYNQNRGKNLYVFPRAIVILLSDCKTNISCFSIL